MENQKVGGKSQNYETDQFLPYLSDEKVNKYKRLCYLRFRDKGPFGAIFKPYNISENSKIHELSKVNNQS